MDRDVSGDRQITVPAAVVLLAIPGREARPAAYLLLTDEPYDEVPETATLSVLWVDGSLEMFGVSPESGRLAIQAFGRCLQDSFRDKRVRRLTLEGPANAVEEPAQVM